MLQRPQPVNSETTTLNIIERVRFPTEPARADRRLCPMARCAYLSPNRLATTVQLTATVTILPALSTSTSTYHRNSRTLLSNLRVPNSPSGKKTPTVSHYITRVLSAAPHDHAFVGPITGEYAVRFRVQSHDSHNGQCGTLHHE